MSESSSIFVVTRHLPFDWGRGAKRVIGLSHMWSYGMTLTAAASKLVCYFNSELFRLLNSDLKQHFELAAPMLINSVYSVNLAEGSLMMAHRLSRTYTADPRLVLNEHGIFVIDITDCWHGSGRASYAFLKIIPMKHERWDNVPILSPMTAAAYLDLYYNDEVIEEACGEGYVPQTRQWCDQLKAEFANAGLMTVADVRGWFPKMFDGKSLKRRAAGIANMNKVGSAGKFKSQSSGKRTPRKVML
jgi:hypothetical protein